MIGLVIFDCDGVLVDSERIANRVFAEVLNELGLSLTLEDMFDTFVGHSTEYCVEIVEQMLGRPAPIDLVQQYAERINAALAKEVKPVEGIENALAQLHKPCCVASSGSHEKMNATLGATGLLERFENRIFSATEVSNSKPHPDVYLYAAEKMGFQPANCLVIEDTPVGVTAGVAAGMTVYGYAELMKPRRLTDAGAVLTFDDMTLLPGLIREPEANRSQS